METDEIVDKVLAEIGIDLTSKLGATPGKELNGAKVAEKPVAMSEGGGYELDPDLQARLNNLRND